MNWNIRRRVPTARVTLYLGIAISFLGCRVSFAQSIAAQQGLQTIALSGTQAPDTLPNTVFGFFNTPIINNLDQIAFGATITGDSRNDSGMFSTTGGGLHLVARAGDQAPGFPSGVNFRQFSSSIPAETGLTNAGATEFWTTVTTSPTKEGMWTDLGGTLTPFVVSGAPAPGQSQANFGNINGFAFADSGIAGFDSTLIGSGVTSSNNRSIWSGMPGALALVARSGDAAPGTPGGTIFSDFTTLGTNPSINSAGVLTFQGLLSGPSVSPTANTGMFAGASEATSRAVALAGAQAPGLPAGAEFANFLQLDSPVINSLGQVAFLGQTTGLGSPSGMSTGIWSEGGGAGLALVALKGTHAAGTPTGVNFSQLNTPVIDNSGDTVFLATLTGSGVNSTNNQGLWINQPSYGLSLVARLGDVAPGTGGEKFLVISAPAVNSSGQMAFVGSVTGPTNVNDGLWFERSPGDLELVVRAGDTFQVAPGVFKTVIQTPELVGSGINDGEQTGLSDNGHLTFALQFTDGSSGVFTVTVPEPSTIALLAIGAISIACLVRRRRPHERLMRSTIGYSTPERRFLNDFS